MKCFNFLPAAAIAATMLTVTSCSKNNDEINDGINEDSKVELLLASGVETQSRAAFTSTDTQIPNGQTVAVYVDEAGGTSQLYGKNVLTANGSGGLSGGETMYFPQSNANVDIYALHTNAALGNTYPTTALTHTVAADQKTLAAYAPSDLLYAKAVNVSKTASAVPLTFNHLLSKIEVAVIPGKGSPNITGIGIGGIMTGAEFTLAKTTAPGAVAITAKGTATTIAVSNDLSTDFVTGAKYNAAVIVPQTIASGTEFIVVYLQTGTSLVYKLPASTTFESGKKYTYNINADLTGITLTSTISNWTAVNSVTGTATY